MLKENNIEAALAALEAYDFKMRRQKTSQICRECGLPRGYKSELGRMRKRLKQILKEIKEQENGNISGNNRD